jgi:hypothetical protein
MSSVPWGRSMGMQTLKRLLLNAAGVEPNAAGVEQIAHSPDFSDSLCVLASRGPGGAVHRLDRLYSCEDATLVASELNREWPSNRYGAAPATADELKAHAAQAAWLMRSIARERS